MAKSRATQHIRQTTQSAIQNLYQFSTGIRNKKVTSDLNTELVQRFDCWSICEASSPPSQNHKGGLHATICQPDMLAWHNQSMNFTSLCWLLFDPICLPDSIGTRIDVYFDIPFTAYSWKWKSARFGATDFCHVGPTFSKKTPRQSKFLESGVEIHVRFTLRYCQADKSWRVNRPQQIFWIGLIFHFHEWAVNRVSKYTAYDSLSDTVAPTNSGV